MKQLFTNLYRVTKTATLKDALIVTGGMGLVSLLSAVSIFLIARFLGPARFGLYVTSLAIALIAIDSIELAISGSIVKFAARKKPDSPQYIKHGLNLKLIIGIVLSLFFILLSRSISALLNPQLYQPLLLAALFIPITFLYRFPRSVLQANKHFVKDAILEIVTNIVRLGLIILFVYLSRLNILTSLLAYMIGLVLALILGTRFISWDFLKVKVSTNTKKSFFRFQKWLTFGFVIAAIHGRIDSTILMRLADASTTGIYQAAYRFFMPAVQFAAVLAMVFAPRFASFNQFSVAKTYLKKASQLSLALAGLVLLMIPLAPWLVRLIFGSAYLSAVLPAQILSLGFCFFIASAPFTAHLIYYTARTKIFFLLNLFQLLLLVTLDILLIPAFQAVGAALATSLTLIIVNLLIIGLALSYKKK